jgi:pimeloyl-ACP methyl ester carboxylesterase
MSLPKENKLSATMTTDLTSGSVESADGTRIGYLRIGQGPAVVVLHGSMQSARSHTQLARALADTYTVYLPDRRGRGMSGQYGEDYSIRTEVDDLQAVMTEADARIVFGVSASGLVALEAARTLPGVRKAAIYEPALLPAGAIRYTQWIERFDREMAQGKVAAALITSMAGLDLAPPAFKIIPRPALEALTSMFMKSEEKKAAADAVTMRKLAPTLHYEGVLIAEMMGTTDTFGDVAADILLLGGSKGLRFLKPALDDLARTLPHNRRVEFAGLDHGGAADVTEANRGGKPEVVAAELRRFFAES